MSTVIQKATNAHTELPRRPIASESVTSEECVAWNGDHGGRVFVLQVGLGDRSDVDVVAIDVG